MKKQPFAVLISALLLGGVAHAQTVSQLWASAQPSEMTTMGPTLGVAQGGSAPVETALATIIPQPYRIELDARVPTTTIVNWKQGTDWMKVLRDALSPLGLSVIPDWSTNTILITLHDQPAPMHPPVAATVTTPAQALVMTPDVNPKAAVAATSTRMTEAQNSESDHANQLSNAVVGADDPGWNQPAPAMPDHPISLSDAVLRLLPTSMAGAQMEIDAVNDDEKVGWLKGQTRIEALRTIMISRGLHAVISGQQIKISPDTPVLATAAPRKPQGPAIVAKPAPIVSHWRIDDGQAISDALKDWGKKAGWAVVWNLHDDWAAPHTTEFSGDFVSAAGDAIKALANNGADIRGTFYQSNKTLVVSAGGSHE